jgi:hypothetical protein
MLKLRPDLGGQCRGLAVSLLAEQLGCAAKRPEGLQAIAAPLGQVGAIEPQGTPRCFASKVAADRVRVLLAEPDVSGGIVRPRIDE